MRSIGENELWKGEERKFLSDIILLSSLRSPNFMISLLTGACVVVVVDEDVVVYEHVSGGHLIHC